MRGMSTDILIFFIRFTANIDQGEQKQQLPSPGGGELLNVYLETVEVFTEVN